MNKAILEQAIDAMGAALTEARKVGDTSLANRLEYAQRSLIKAWQAIIADSPRMLPSLAELMTEREAELLRDAR